MEKRYKTFVILITQLRNKIRTLEEVKPDIDKLLEHSPYRFITHMSSRNKLVFRRVYRYSVRDKAIDRSTFRIVVKPDFVYVLDVKAMHEGKYHPYQYRVGRAGIKKAIEDDMTYFLMEKI